MFKPNYELIDSIPEVESYREQLPEIISQFEMMRGFGGEYMEKMALGVLIEMCAQNFYGIDLNEASSMSELISLIKSVDSEMQFS